MTLKIDSTKKETSVGTGSPVIKIPPDKKNKMEKKQENIIENKEISKRLKNEV